MTTHISLSVAIAMLIFAVSGLTGYAQIENWEQTPGPEGAFIIDLATFNNAVYASTSTGLYYLPASSQTWKKISGLGGKLYNGQHSLFISNSGNFYRIHKSSPDQVEPISHPNLDHYQLSGIADNEYDNTLFITDRFYIYTSYDEGTTWLTRYLSEATRVQADTQLCVATTPCKTMFVGTATGLLRSTDYNHRGAYGLAFIPCGNFNRVKHITAHRGSIFVSDGSNSCFRSDNDGFTWTPLQFGTGTLELLRLVPVNNYLFAHFLDKATQNTLLYRYDLRTESYNIVYRSTDPVGTECSGAFRTLAAGDTVLYAGTRIDGVYRSVDYGETWELLNSGFNSISIYSLAVQGSSLFAGTHCLGVFRTDDKGDHWISVNNGISNQDILFLVASETTLFAGTRPGEVFRSTDKGDSWLQLSINNEPIYALTPVGTILLAGSNYDAPEQHNRLYRSEDNGATWTLANQGLENEVITRCAAVGSIAFVGTESGSFYRSDDGGSSWSFLSQPTQSPVSDIHSINSVLYINSDRGVLRSDDFGRTWTEVEGLGGRPRIIDIVTYNDFLMLATDFSLARSHNGRVWSYLPRPPGRSWKIEALEVLDGTVFAGLWSSNDYFAHGMWRADADIVMDIPEQMREDFVSSSPNPASSFTTLRYSLSDAGTTVVTVFDVLGNVVATVNGGFTPAGEHSTVVDVGNLPQGMYYWHVQSGGTVKSGKFLVVR